MIASLEASLPMYAVPKSTIPEKIDGAKPAAGPLIVTYDPPRKGRTKPAMIADMIPQIAGAPDVIAIPIENGSEIIATMNPERMSKLQCFNPARPFCGTSTLAVVEVDMALLDNPSWAEMAGDMSAERFAIYFCCARNADTSTLVSD